MGAFVNLTIGGACQALWFANLSSAQTLFNDVKETEQTKLVITKLVTGICFGGIFLTTKAVQPLKNKFSPLAIVAPLAMTMSTFVVSQVAKKMGTYSKALETFDKISDRVMEVAFSVASVVCLILYARQVNWAVSQWNLAFTGLSLAASAAAIIYKIVCVVRSYLPSPKAGREPIISTSKTGREPIVSKDFNINSLGLNIYAKVTIKKWSGEDDDVPIEEEITMVGAIRGTIEAINKILVDKNKQGTECSDNAVLKERRRFEINLYQSPWCDYRLCNSALIMPKTLENSWLSLIINALIARGHLVSIKKMTGPPKGAKQFLKKQLYEIQA